MSTIIENLIITMAPGVQKKRLPKEKKIKQKEITKPGKSVTKKLVFKIRCPICFNNLSSEAVVSTMCGHVFCRQCLHKALSLNPECPTCRKKIRGAGGYHTLYMNSNVWEDFMDD